MLPYGVPFDSLSFLYLTSGHFFDFKNLLGLSRFLALRFFILTEGWDGVDGMDGMGGMDGMDGMVGQLFFFCPYLENYYIFFLNCFSSLKYMFLHIFWNIRRKKSECSFFQNISPKSTTTFFSKIFTRISQISRKLLNIFSSLFLVPLEE